MSHDRRGQELDRGAAAVGEPLDERPALRRQRADQRAVLGRDAAREQIGGEALGIVVDAGLALPASPGGDHGLSGGGGTAAQVLRALDEDHLAAAVGCRDRGGQAAHARAHHDKICTFASVRPRHRRAP